MYGKNNIQMYDIFFEFEYFKKKKHNDRTTSCIHITLYLYTSQIFQNISFINLSLALRPTVLLK